MHDLPLLEETDAVHPTPLAPFAELFGGVIELTPTDDIDHPVSCPERLFRQHGDMRTGQHRNDIRFELLDATGGLDVDLQRRGGGVHHHHVEPLGNGEALLQVKFLHRGINDAAPLDHAGRKTEPGRIPEGGHFTGSLIAGTGAAVEVLKSWRV